jgi:hypothetical protein
MPEAQTGLGGTGSLVGHATCARLQVVGAMVPGFFSNSLFSMKTLSYFFLNLFPTIPASNRQKEAFFKNNVRFCMFVSYLVRFWSKVLGKVDIFWMHRVVMNRNEKALSHR